NYRLGPFGFLYGDREDAPGNVGFYDQLLALKWGLFKKAIIESGVLMFNKDRDMVNTTEALVNSKTLAKQLKCNETEDWLQCLRRADAKDIVKYGSSGMTFPVFGTDFLPIRTQQAINDKKFNTDIDFMSGITHDEGSMFANMVVKDPDHMALTDFHNGVKALESYRYFNIDFPKVTEHYLKGVNTSSPAALRTAFIALFSDISIICPTYLFAKRFAQTVKESQRVYFYELLYKSEWFAKQAGCSATMGVCHMMELPFVFGLPLLDPHHYSPEDIHYSNVVMKMWTTFAKSGHMDSDWPQLLNDEPMGAPKVHGLDPKDLRLVLKDPIDVETSIGVVRGRTLHVLDTNVDQFVGIPYAEPPVGKHRFAKPEPISKPFPVTLKPVMFWIHGGSLNMGSIFLDWFNGSVLATHDVVVVSVNYRLGPFGFLYGDREDAPGNVGLYDQLLGLKWVRENIHSFGGDRDQITIFGESAGSWSVSAHILSPLSKGLFKRAIMQSGAHLYNKDRDVFNKTEALSLAKFMAKDQKCNETKDWIQCLRRVDAKDLVKYEAHDTYPLFGTEFLPIPTRQALHDKKFNSDIDLLSGITQDEGSTSLDTVVKDPKHVTLADFHNAFTTIESLGFHNIEAPKLTEYYLKGVNTSDTSALRTAIAALFSDLTLGCPTYLFAKRFAQTVKESQRVYFYELLYRSDYYSKQIGCDLTTMGICHMSDLPFVFGLPLRYPNEYTTDDIIISKYVIKMWTTFAKTGHMDSDWPQLLNDEPMGAPKVHGLDPKDLRLVLSDPFHATCDGVWADYFL
ncbi:unnamed protein product, partial [Medioppia subpectinata]